ncbi:MAG TPA: hypothetical protein VMF52_12245 [Steroidobacteraceae bacterium]|nr:hypothetical protein [Steroidobacteraceae bacterium]
MNTPNLDDEAQAVLDVLEGRRDAAPQDPPVVHKAQSIRETRDDAKFEQWVSSELEDYSPTLSDAEVRALDGEQAAAPSNVVELTRPAKSAPAVAPATPRRWWRVPNTMAASFIVAALTAGIVVQLSLPPTPPGGDRATVRTEWQIGASAPAVTASRVAEKLRAAGLTVTLTERPGSWVLVTNVPDANVDAARRALEAVDDAQLAAQLKLRAPLAAGELWITFYAAEPGG